MPDNITAIGASRRRRRMLAICALFAAFLLLAACGGAGEASDGASSPEPEPDTVVTDPANAGIESPEPAAADATVTGVDYAFDVDDISAGDTVEFVNGSDKEAHEMVAMRVTDDSVTLEDIQQLLADDPEGPPPEFLEQAGFAFAMPGETAEETVTFEQGRYLLLCFIPQNAPPDVVAEMIASAGSEEPEVPSELQSELGPPHAVAGMVDLIEVD